VFTVVYPVARPWSRHHLILVLLQWGYYRCKQDSLHYQVLHWGVKSDPFISPLRVYLRPFWLHCSVRIWKWLFWPDFSISCEMYCEQLPYVSQELITAIHFVPTEDTWSSSYLQRSLPFMCVIHVFLFFPHICPFYLPTSFPLSFFFSFPFISSFRFVIWFPDRNNDNETHCCQVRTMRSWLIALGRVQTGTYHSKYQTHWLFRQFLLKGRTLFSRYIQLRAIMFRSKMD
jgi:hypothetical protein